MACFRRGGVLVACAALGTPLPFVPTAAGASAAGRVVLHVTETENQLRFDVPRNTVLPRGVTVSFVVTNAGHRPHGFAILGHTVGTLRPGQTARTPFIVFSRRGRYVFFDPLHRSSKLLRGHITIV